MWRVLSWGVTPVREATADETTSENRGMATCFEERSSGGPSSNPERWCWNRGTAQAEQRRQRLERVSHISIGLSVMCRRESGSRAAGDCWSAIETGSGHAYPACISKQWTIWRASVNRSGTASASGGCVNNGLRAGCWLRGGDIETTSHDMDGSGLSVR